MIPLLGSLLIPLCSTLSIQVACCPVSPNQCTELTSPLSPHCHSFLFSIQQPWPYSLLSTPQILPFFLTTSLVPSGLDFKYFLPMNLSICHKQTVKCRKVALAWPLYIVFLLINLVFVHIIFQDISTTIIFNTFCHYLCLELGWRQLCKNGYMFFCFFLN